MTHTIVVSGITALVLATSPISAAADGLELSIGPKGGLGLITQGGKDAESEFARTLATTGYLYGIDVTVAPLSRVAFGLELMRMKKGAAVELTDGSDAGTLEFDYLGAAAVADVRILTSGMFIPYVRTGVQLGFLLETLRIGPGGDPVIDLTEDTTSMDVGVIAGAGLGIRFTPQHEVTLEGRVDIGLRTTDASVNENEQFNRSLMFMAGYRYWILSSGAGTSRRRAPDTDQDGVPDAKDKCADEAEDMDGFQDDDGCPDLDNDGDEIADVNDECPNEAEDMDGFEDENGCPDLDNDGDGVPDDKDRCAVEKEDANGFQDDDGCPDAEDDSDGDLVLDPVDKCLEEAGFYTEDGCPKTYEHVRVEEKRVVLLGDAGTKLFTMRRKKATDKLSDEAKPVLDELAQALEDHPGIGSVQIDAHNARKGRAQLQLAQRQAKAIRAYLIDEKGVEEARVLAKGQAGTPVAGEDKDKDKDKARDVVIISIVETPADE